MTSERRRRAGILLLLALLLAPAGASAHAVLVGSLPGDGSRLDRPPTEVSLRFNEPIAPVSLRVIGAAGEAVATGPATAATDGTLRLTLPPDLPAGRYVVSYRVTSADGHPVAGSLTFAVGADPPPAAAAPPSMVNDRWVPALVLNRALTDLALLATAGGAAFVLLVLGGPRAPEARRLRPWLTAGAALAALGTLASVGLAGGALGDLPAAGLLGAEPWRLGLTSSTGTAALTALASLSLLGLGLIVAGRPLIWLGAIGAALSLALTGHAATAPPRALATPTLAVHVLGVAWWLGALVPLLLVLRNRPPEAAAALVQRFSRLAVPLVGLLLLAGLVLAALQLRAPHALVATGYGMLLSLKLLMVAILLGLAIWNRLRLTPALARGEPTAPRRLRRSIAAEIACAVLILTLTAALTRTPPPRAAAEPVLGQLVLSERGRRLRLAVTPGRAGHNRIVAALEDEGGQALEALAVELVLALPAMSIEPLVRPMTPLALGRWQWEGNELSVAGRWRLRLDALIDDFDKAIFEAEIEIGSAIPAAAHD